jgi:hypothetical protein
MELSKQKFVFFQTGNSMTTTELNFSSDEAIQNYLVHNASCTSQTDLIAASFVENVSDAGIKQILASKLVDKLKRIYFNFCENIRVAETFSDLPKATNLQDLSFLYCSVLDNKALYFVSQCATIESLSVIGCVSADPWTMQNISSMTNLKKLTINHNEYLTTEDISAISTLSNLAELDMEDIHLNNESLFSIVNASGSSNFKRLNIEENPDVTNVGFHNLTKLGNLEALRIGVCQATDVGWKSIGKLTQLTALQILGSTNLTNNGFQEFIIELTRLKELQVCFCDQLTQEFVHETLSRLTNLTKISVTDID